MNTKLMTRHRFRTLFFITVSLLLMTGLQTVQAVTEQGDPGKVRIFFRQGPAFDYFINNATPDRQQAMNAKFWRTEEFHPHFDKMTSWYPNAMDYMDSQAVYVKPGANMNWVLKDKNGQPLYINWGCHFAAGTCPQYAADLTNTSPSGFRAWWISQAQEAMALGYRGLWVDDVNLSKDSQPINLVHTDGTKGVPVDSNTGQEMTAQQWNHYVVDFMTQIRNSIPADKEILHNSLWFAGNGDQGTDPSVQQQIAQADLINIEAGICDSGITGGDSYWSLSHWFTYVDRIHALGKGVVINNAGCKASQEYTVAGYFMISNGTDAMDYPNIDPVTNWYPGFDVSLGAPTGDRFHPSGNKHLWERDFQNGIVLLNEPHAPPITFPLPGTFHRIDGSLVTSVSLNARDGAVLER